MDELRLAQSTKMRLLLAVCSLAGVSLCLAPCDDAKFNIKIDLPDRKVYQCPEDPWPVPETVIPSLTLWHPEQGALQYCMDREIEYNVSIPNSGAHRPSGARYGEYEFCPPQRWIKNLQHGAVAFLYHPCVNPVLKEDLRLLARACLYKYVITPHVSLTKDRPLALVAWTATLEMQHINLTEAMAWLRGNEGRAPGRQVKDVAVYDYLLMHQAKKGLRNINIKLCGENREVESRQGTVKMKWGVGHGASNHLKLMKRRKREVSVASSSNNSSPDAIAMLTVAEHLQGHSAATSLLKDRVYDETTIDVNKSLSQEHSQASRISSITRDYDGAVPSLGDSPGRISERNNENGTEVTLSTLENAEHSKISHQEGTNAKGIVGVQESLKSAVQKSMFGVGSINNSENIKSSVNFRVSKALELRDTGRGGIGGTLMSTAPLLGSGGNLKVKNTSQLPPIPEHVEQSSSSVKSASNEEILQEGGLLKANNSKQLVRLGNHSHILASSKHEFTKNSSNPESTKQDEQGTLTEDSRISQPNITYPKNSSTVSQATSENGGVGEEGRGKEQCNCLKGVPHELDLHSNEPAMAQEGILDSNKHIQGGQEVPRAVADMFVRTPRTEEAAWAAAALTFLFVLLTLSVLYTRLWRKFRKSESLYWAPDSDQEGQETVSAVIKRRLTVGQARRKKRQNYKKRPLVLYEDLSDSSD